jgi:hypothetical protein
MTLNGHPAPTPRVEEPSDEARSAGASAPPVPPDPEVVTKPKASNPLEPKGRGLEAEAARLEKDC